MPPRLEVRLHCDQHLEHAMLFAKATLKSTSDRIGHATADLCCTSLAEGNDFTPKRWRSEALHMTLVEERVGLQPPVEWTPEGRLDGFHTSS